MALMSLILCALAPSLRHRAFDASTSRGPAHATVPLLSVLEMARRCMKCHEFAAWGRVRSRPHETRRELAAPSPVREFHRDEAVPPHEPLGCVDVRLRVSSRGWAVGATNFALRWPDGCARSRADTRGAVDSRGRLAWMAKADLELVLQTAQVGCGAKASPRAVRQRTERVSAPVPGVRPAGRPRAGRPATPAPPRSAARA